ncbi:MAG: hypothetical protein E6R14_03350 [Thermomicrobiales bacterium]|nr:MAG: hypothetical protein E6R14_03350 [Thermomicrobiales bacterium]
MIFDVGVALTWILFLALFPLAYFWLRRAWRIFVRRDFSEVALRRGVAPGNAERFAPFEGVINLVAGCVVVLVVFGVVVAQMPYQTWTAIAGTTIWCKFFASFILSRHAHPIK